MGKILRRNDTNRGCGMRIWEAKIAENMSTKIDSPHTVAPP